VRDAVLLNAAAALVASEAGDLADGLPKALDRCAEAVDSGAAADTLRRWVAAARS
jgi:anthranilate phosphoribosyltransferase